MIQFCEVFIKFLEFKQIVLCLKLSTSLIFLGLKTKRKAD